MATIYKAKAVGVTETITARVYSNGEEIHSAHPLYPKTTYQWYLDRLNGQPHEEIAGATSNSYNVPLGDVSNSGEYYCKFTIGLTGCTVEYSPRTRISIVSCEGSVVAPNPVPWEGTTTQVTILHAKFETAVFSNEGLSWVTHISSTPCAACLSTTTTVATFSVVANSGENRARRGQVSLAVGGLKCYYNLVQDYQRTLAADGTEADPPPAPFIELDDNGPATAGGKVTVQAKVGVTDVDDDGTTGDYTITWSAGNRFSINEADRQALYTKTDEGTITVTATVTDNNTLLTDTAGVNINFEAGAVDAGGDTIVGTPFGQSNMGAIAEGISIYGFDNDGNSLPRTNSQEFEITGEGIFSLYMSISPNGLFFDQNREKLEGSSVTRLEATLEGPGALGGKEVIMLDATGSTYAESVKAFAGIGHYTLSLRWYTSIQPYPSAGAFPWGNAKINVGISEIQGDPQDLLDVQEDLPFGFPIDYEY